MNLIFLVGTNLFSSPYTLELSLHQVVTCHTVKNRVKRVWQTLASNGRKSLSGDFQTGLFIEIVKKNLFVLLSIL